MTSRTSSGRRLGGIITRAAAAGALILGTVGLAAAPAQAIGGCSTSAANGTVGVTQILDVTDCNGSGQVTVSYASGAAQQYLPLYSGQGPNALASWTPSSAGTAYLSIGPDATNTVTVGKVTTTTIVNAPDNAKVGTATKIQVIVQSQSQSSYSPTGQITVVNANGAPVSGAMGLTAGPGAGQSYAYFWWTPTTTGTFYFKAQYNGDANANGSGMSPQDAVIVTPSGNTISISAPPVMTLGQSVTLTASVFPAGVQGSVGFTINGAPISAAIPINAQGQASMTWTPNIAGQVTLGASYTTNQGGSGSTSEVVTINNAPAQQDRITLIQPGWGPWQPNGTYSLGNGSNFAFQASSLSGAPVVLTETGPCQLNGLTITVPTGSGQCNLQASTNGGNGYAPVTYGYTVNLIPGNQVANVAAPQSGDYNAGRTLTLEGPGNSDTNAGQNINWFITKGKNKICTLQFKGNGAVKLKLLKKGHCMVKANAPGVPGQWNAFSLKRSYHAV